MDRARRAAVRGSGRCTWRPTKGVRGASWQYVGRVGTGFSDRLLERVARRRSSPPRASTRRRAPARSPRRAGTTGRAPCWWCEVRFKERTVGWAAAPAGVFGACATTSSRRSARRRRSAFGGAGRPRPPHVAPANRRRRTPACASRSPIATKVFWPEQGYTKSDLDRVLSRRRRRRCCFYLARPARSS